MKTLIGNIKIFFGLDIADTIAVIQRVLIKMQTDQYGLREIIERIDSIEKKQELMEQALTDLLTRIKQHER